MNNRPPNLSALYDFYRYASGGIVPKKAKPVGKEKTVPTALDWGPNVPMDYLAYLNKQEMALIQEHRAFKGKRSHEGIPAFPDPGDTGYGDKGQGTTSSSGLGGGNKTSGGGNAPGGGGGGGGGASGSRGSSTGSVGPSSGSQAPGNAGTGGQRGAGSNYGPGSGRPTVGGTPSRSSDRGFTAPNSDRQAMQRTQVSDAIRTLNSTPSVRNDLAIGGIRSISVGIVGSPVNVGPTIATPQAPEGMFGPRIGISTPDYMKVASQPGVITSGMPSSFSGSLPNETVVKKTTPDYVGKYSGPSFNQDSDLQRSAIDKAVSESVMNASLSAEATPSAVPESLRPVSGVSKFSTISGIGDIYDPNADIAGSVKIPNWSQSSYTGPSAKTPTKKNDKDVQSLSPSQEPLSEDLAKNVDPVTGQPAYPEDNWVMKGAKKAGIIGKAIQLADWASRKNFSNMTPAEQAAEMGRWAEKREEYRRNDAKVNDRGAYIPPPKRMKSIAEDPALQSSKDTSSTQRPAQYYKWDLGVGIPSQSDSDYPLYLKYLQEKAAQDAATS